MSDGFYTMGEMSVESSNGSGKYERVESFAPTNFSSTTFSSDGKGHAWKISEGIDPVNDFSYLGYLSQRTGAELARAYEVTISLINRGKIEKPFYTLVVPEVLTAVLFVDDKAVANGAKDFPKVCLVPHKT